MFTDRFIKIPIKVYSTSLKELTGKEDLHDHFCKILPMEICEYYPTEEDDQDAVQVYLKNGRGYIVYMTFQDFEKLLNSFGHDR